MGKSKKTRPPEKDKGKAKTVVLRPIDQERLDFAKKHTGIASEVDVIRFLLADYTSRAAALPSIEPHAAGVR